TLFGYVRGHAVDLEPEYEAARSSGVSGEDWMRAQEARLAALVDGGAFPAFAAARGGSALSPESLFRFGLAAFLDGLATRVAPAAPRAAAAPAPDTAEARHPPSWGCRA
ncbi:TetR/AcrR family transcriptional regulator C-terminal domain-containing protein, partial [Streptomyces sp. NBC_00091]|uniref:TetR/AcrR family transcriptional regulator C-terminal domain-containing protein n=1 Tax=Streptomyces sp. NBC_00091 TaxID=2975648 RepID=UPI0022529F74